MSATAKRMICTILILLLVLVAAGVLFYRSLSGLYFAAGVILGCAASVLKVAMLNKAVEVAVDMENNRAVRYIGVQYLIRFLLTGAALLIAVFCPFISLWGAVAGILTMQMAAFSVGFRSKRAPAEDKPPG